MKDKNEDDLDADQDELVGDDLIKRMKKWVHRTDALKVTFGFIVNSPISKGNSWKDILIFSRSK